MYFLKSREFFLLWQYVGMSIAQGGSGMSFLAPQVYSYFTTGDHSKFEVNSDIISAMELTSCSMGSKEDLSCIINAFKNSFTSRLDSA